MNNARTLSRRVAVAAGTLAIALLATTPAPAATVSAPLTPAFPQLAAGVGGTGALLLPQVATGGGWVSQITIANTSPFPQTVRVDLFNAAGAPLSTPFGSTIPSVVIAPGGVATLVL